MYTIKKLKIGLAGVMCTPFRGDKEGLYQASQAALENLARTLDFELQVIPTGIYTLEQATSAAQQLQDARVDFILLQNTSFASGDFIYPFADLSRRQGARLGLWAIPEGPPTSEGGLPLNSFTSLNLYNSILKTEATAYPHPVKWFFGPPGQPLFDERLAITVKALRALVHLRGAKIGLVGGVAPSFNNLIVEPAHLKNRLEISIVEIPLEEILARAGQMAEQKIQAAAQRLQARASRVAPNQEQALAKTARVTLALHTVAQDYGLQALAVSCWPRFQSDYSLAVCTTLGDLNTDGLVAACEGDVASAVSMLALRAMTGGEPVTLMDLATVDLDDESILLWHCGPTSPSLADEHGTTLESLWLFDQPDGQQIGLHNDLVLRPGRGTILGFTPRFDQLLVLDGIVDNQKASYNGSRGWFRSLHMNGRPVSVPALLQSILDSGFQHHYPFAFGDLAGPGMELACWLGIPLLPTCSYTPYLSHPARGHATC